jgi:uncharacterized membrane protein
MFETTLSYQKSGYIDIGWIMPMLEPKISRKKKVISDSDILNVVENYAKVLRHSEEKVLFRDFLLVQLNDIYFNETHPTGLYIEDKERLKDLIRENIPEDVEEQYWEINRSQNVNYVKDFSKGHVKRISCLMRESANLEELLEIQAQIEEANEPTPLLPQEYDAITEYLKDHSEEEAISRWSEDLVYQVLYDEEL